MLGYSSKCSSQAALQSPGDSQLYYSMWCYKAGVCPVLGDTRQSLHTMVSTYGILIGMGHHHKWRSIYILVRLLKLCVTQDKYKNRQTGAMAH